MLWKGEPMRAIDADSLITDCKKYLGILNPDGDAKEYARIFWLIGILRQAPTIEPERIVRCKDCKYYHGSDGCFFSTAETEENGFCYWAERKDGSCHST